TSSSFSLDCSDLAEHAAVARAGSRLSADSYSTTTSDDAVEPREPLAITCAIPTPTATTRPLRSTRATAVSGVLHITSGVPMFSSICPFLPYATHDVEPVVEIRLSSQ